MHLVRRRLQRDTLRILACRQPGHSEMQFVAAIAGGIVEAAKDGRWRTAESLLHALSAGARSIPSSETDFTPKVLSCMLEITPQAPLACACVVLIGMSL